MKKPTKATFKAFLKKHQGNLYVKVRDTFDGMTDGLRDCENVWKPAQARDDLLDHTCGLMGVWLVGNSRDYFDFIEDEHFKGIKVYNSCGSFSVGVKK